MTDQLTPHLPEWFSTAHSWMRLLDSETPNGPPLAEQDVAHWMTWHGAKIGDSVNRIEFELAVSEFAEFQDAHDEHQSPDDALELVRTHVYHVIQSKNLQLETSPQNNMIEMEMLAAHEPLRPMTLGAARALQHQKGRRSWAV